jgi:hypothetical protein
VRHYSKFDTRALVASMTGGLQAHCRFGSKQRPTPTLKARLAGWSGHGINSRLHCDACKPLFRGLYSPELENALNRPVRGPVVILTFAFFALGFSLAGFGVLAILVATALSTPAWLIYDLVNGATLVQALLRSAFFAFVLQAGYLVGQVLRPSRS